MAIDPVTGLTEGEARAIDEALKPYFAENSITPIYSPYYASFAKTIKNKSTQEAQIDLNKWNARGLNKTHLLTIARDVCNKNLV